MVLDAKKKSCEIAFFCRAIQMLIRYAFKKWSGARLLPLYLELKCIHKTMACNKNENRYKNKKMSYYYNNYSSFL